jgi:hypothetical protein
MFSCIIHELPKLIKVQNFVGLSVHQMSNGMCKCADYSQPNNGT